MRMDSSRDILRRRIVCMYVRTYVRNICIVCITFFAFNASKECDADVYVRVDMQLMQCMRCRCVCTYRYAMHALYALVRTYVLCMYIRKYVCMYVCMHSWVCRHI